MEKVNAMIAHGGSCAIAFSLWLNKALTTPVGGPWELGTETSAIGVPMSVSPGLENVPVLA